jgi:hypothetical protein
MASSRGCWLLLHVLLRLGACITRFSSPASGVSWSAWAWAPRGLVAVALVAEAGAGRCLGFGSLAGTVLPVEVVLLE